VRAEVWPAPADWSARWEREREEADEAMHRRLTEPPRAGPAGPDRARQRRAAGKR